MENRNRSLVSNAPLDNRRDSLIEGREKIVLSSGSQHNAESLLATPTREELLKLTKNELQKLCRQQKLNNIWVKKNELIDMLIVNARNTSDTNEVDDHLVQNNDQSNENQYIRQFILETNTRFEAVNHKLNEKEKEVKALKNRLVSAEHMIERLQQKMDSYDNASNTTSNMQSTNEAKTLILGDSSLKEMKSSDLAEHCKIRTIPGANLDLLKCWVTDMLTYKVKECVIHCGVQDLFEPNSKVETILDALGALVAELRTKNEDITVKICELIPCIDSTIMENRVENFNLKLVDWCVSNGITLINTELHFRLATGEIDESCFTSTDDATRHPLTRIGAIRLLEAMGKKCDGILCDDWKKVKKDFFQTQYNGKTNNIPNRPENVKSENTGRNSTFSWTNATQRDDQRRRPSSYTYTRDSNHRPQPPTHDERRTSYQSTNLRNTTRRRGCYNCGELNHVQSTCRYDRRLQCTACHKYGHKSRMCDSLNYH